MSIEYYTKPLLFPKKEIYLFRGLSGPDIFSNVLGLPKTLFREQIDCRFFFNLNLITGVKLHELYCTL